MIINFVKKKTIYTIEKRQLLVYNNKRQNVIKKQINKFKNKIIFDYYSTILREKYFRRH